MRRKIYNDMESTPTRRKFDRRAEEEVLESPDSRTSEQLDAKVRYPPRDSLRLYASAKTHDRQSLSSFTRQFTYARTRPLPSASQTSLFEVLRPLRPQSPTVIVRSGPASLASPSIPHNSPPNALNATRLPPQILRSETTAEAVGNVLVLTVTQLADQVAALSAAQITAFSSIMQRVEEMRAALPPNPPNLSIPTRPPTVPSAISANAIAGASFPRVPPQSAPAPIYQTLSQADA